MSKIGNFELVSSKIYKGNGDWVRRAPSDLQRPRNLKQNSWVLLKLAGGMVTKIPVQVSQVDWAAVDRGRIVFYKHVEMDADLKANLREALIETGTGTDVNFMA